MNIEGTEALAFKYDRTFHTSHRHTKLAMNRTEPWENAATENCELQLWLMTETSEVHRVQPILHQHSAILLTLTYPICLSYCNVVVFLHLFSPEHQLQKVSRLWKHPWGKFFFDNFKKSLVVVSFHFHQELKNILEWLLSYKVNLL